MFDRVHHLLTDDAAPAAEELGKLAALSGVREYPARVKCASLCWHTLASALQSARRAVPARPFPPNEYLNMHCYENEPIVVQRDVKAVAIPAGVEVNLKLGSVGYITQALGGSFTVYIDGNLFRIAGQDADAIGKTAAKPPEVPPGASEEDIKNVVWQQLKTCYDPEIPVNIVDLGLVYECDVTKNRGCDPHGRHQDDADGSRLRHGRSAGAGRARQGANRADGGARANVELVFDPPWNHTMMSDEARLQTGMM